MEDLSLHILDIVDNSLRAGAENVAIRLREDLEAHTLILEIEDDGPGMDDETLQHAMSPFFTTKGGKKFGIGLSLLCQSAEDTGGTMRLERAQERGIKLTAIFHTNHADMKPLGNIAKTVRLLRFTHPEVNFSFEHVFQD
jgi:signal transduction histidine kinase